MTRAEYKKGKRHGKNGREQHHFEMFIHRSKYNLHCLTEEEETLCGHIMAGVGLGISIVSGLLILLFGVF